MTHGHYSLEYLPNIQQLIVYIHVDTTNIERNCSLYYDKASKRLFSSATCDTQDNLLINFPGSANVSISLDFVALSAFPQVSRIDNVLVIQFRGAKMHSAPTCSPSPLLNAKALQNCTKLACASCDAPLLQCPSSKFITFKDLPNEHWLELLDCWSCHDNEFAPIAQRALSNDACPEHEHAHNHNHGHSYHHSLSHSGHGYILPPPGKIYLGLDHLLLHDDDGVTPLCPSCKSVIGESFMTSHVKLFRDSVTFYFADDAQLKREPLNRILMHRILDTVDNHSTFHFLLRAPNQPRIYLRIFNWMISVCSNYSVWKPAFKVGFAVASDHTDVETINLSPSRYAAIMSKLESSHKAALFCSRMKLPDSSSLKLAYIVDE